MNAPQPSRGEVWYVDLNPTRGREQAGIRPALVVSVNPFNHGPADLVVALPITSKHKGIPLHVVLDPPEGGLKQQSFVKCEDVRSISKVRLIRRVGAIRAESLAEVAQKLRRLLGL